MASGATWTCPATGLLSFKTSFGYISNTTNIAIYLQLLHNSNGVTSNINWFLNPAGTGSPDIYYDNLLSMTKGDTLEWMMAQAYNPTDATVTLQFRNSTFVGLMIAPGYTAAPSCYSGCSTFPNSSYNNEKPNSWVFMVFSCPSQAQGKQCKIK